MTVSFNVVGIFFSKDVVWSAFPGNTVGDLMSYVASTDSDFSYATTTVTSSSGVSELIVTQFTYVHQNDFVSPRSKIAYGKGTYTLPDPNGSPNTPHSYAVWQYYLADASGVRQPVGGTKSFTKATVADGWSVFWRLVQISNGPVMTRKRFRNLIPQSGRKMEGIA